MVGDKMEHIWKRDELCSSKDSVYVGSGVCKGRVPGPTKNSDGSIVVTSEVIDVSTSTTRIENDIQCVDPIRCIHSYLPGW